MESENEFKKHLLKIIQESDPNIDISNVHIVDVAFPHVNLSEFSVRDLARLYAFSIVNEDYVQAKKIKEEFAKRDCRVELDIDKQKNVGTLNVYLQSKKEVEHIEVKMFKKWS